MQRQHSSTLAVTTTSTGRDAIQSIAAFFRTEREWGGQPLLIGWIRDQAEHYGKLVSNYRAVGIVPPVSRKPASQ